MEYAMRPHGTLSSGRPSPGGSHPCLSKMQECFRVLLVDFLACLGVDLRLVHKPPPRLQEGLPFVPPVGIICRKDDVVRAEDVEAAGEGIGIHRRRIVVHRLPVVARRPGDGQLPLTGRQETVEALDEVGHHAGPEVMHDDLELRQLLQNPTNDESEQRQARVHGPPEQEIGVAFGTDEVQYHRRSRVEPHRQPTLSRAFIDREQLRRVKERPVDVRADLKPFESETVHAPVEFAPEQPPPEQLQPCRLPVPSHPSCPCAAVRAGGLPAASSAGQPLARGVRADPRRGQQRAGWHGVAWGGRTQSVEKAV
jgi:hypothetical protein